MTGKPALNRIRTETGQELPGLETETRQRIERGNELSVPNPWIWIPGSTPVYGDFTYINGTTIPSKVSGLYIGGTALYSEYQMITGNTKE